MEVVFFIIIIAVGVILYIYDRMLTRYMDELDRVIDSHASDIDVIKEAVTEILTELDEYDEILENLVVVDMEKNDDIQNDEQ